MTTRADIMMSAAAAYNKVAEQYDESFHSNVALAEDDVIYGFLRKWLNPGWTIDLGCGTGALLDHINLGKSDYWGVDAARKDIDIYTVNLIYTGEEAKVIKAILGNRPAPIILDWCHKAYEKGERFEPKK